MELWIHVHRVHWVHFHSGLFGFVDWSRVHPRPGRRLDLDLQIHSEGRHRARRAFAFVPRVKNGRCTRSQTCRRALRLLPRDLRRRSTRGWWRGAAHDAGLVGSAGYPHRIRARCGILLRRWHSGVDLDRRSPIMCDDCGFLDSVLRGRCRGGWPVRPPRDLEGHRPGHGEPVSG